MSTPTPVADNPADPLGEILHLLRLTGTLYCRAELTSPWGLDVPPMSDSMMFVVVTAGHCWLSVEGSEPTLLEAGSLALMPHGAGHLITSEPGERTEPLFGVPVERVSERYEIMHHGGGGDVTRAFSGAVRLDHAAAKHLIPLLPSLLLVDPSDREESWIRSTIRLISAEAAELRPGGETVITRLADVLIIQVIRSWIDSSAEATEGWLGALSDDRIGRSLAMIHREPGRDWSVASLAAGVGMSRSGFSERFTRLVGQPAMGYLTAWRMLLAQTRLAETEDSIGRIAVDLGYSSEAAFGRAFKREVGSSPGSVRRGTPT